MSDDKKILRSTAWFGGHDKGAFVHRSWMKNQGFPDHEFDGRPVIGICNSWSELTPCNAHFRQIAEHVKRGVYEAGGFPLEFPVMSLGESNLRPTAMMFRNLASMDVEEIDPRQSHRRRRAAGGLRQDDAGPAHGCGQLRPAGDRRLRRSDAERQLPRPSGSAPAPTLCRFSEEVRAGTHVAGRFRERGVGHEPVAGQLQDHGYGLHAWPAWSRRSGIGLPTNAAIPAVDSRRYVLAHMAGRRIVEMVREDLTMSRILTREAFENAIRINAAIGGSTNAVLHLIALAGRIGVDSALETGTASAATCRPSSI